MAEPADPRPTHDPTPGAAGEERFFGARGLPVPELESPAAVGRYGMRLAIAELHALAGDLLDLRRWFVPPSEAACNGDEPLAGEALCWAALEGAVEVDLGELITDLERAVGSVDPSPTRQTEPPDSQATT